MVLLQFASVFLHFIAGRLLLSEPGNWDGRLAGEFRGHWADTHQKLLGIQQALEELRRQVHQINQNIMQAGGNM